MIEQTPIRRVMVPVQSDPYQHDVFPILDSSRKEQSIIGGSWMDFTDGRTPDQIETLPAGTSLVACILDPVGSTMRYVRVGGGGNCIAVILTRHGSGGTLGSGTTACTATYDVTNLDGNAVKDGTGATVSNLSPTHNRPVGLTTVAKRGTLGRKADGTFELYQTDETTGTIQRSCP